MTVPDIANEEHVEVSVTPSAASADYGASCTSVYTKTEKKDAYDSLEKILNDKCADPDMRQVIRDLMGVCADITQALRTALVTVEGSTNDFGAYGLISIIPGADTSTSIGFNNDIMTVSDIFTN